MPPWGTFREMSPSVSSLMSHDRVSPRARRLCHAVAVSELGFGGSPLKSQGLLIAQLVKNLPAMQKTWVRLLGQEDPLEKGMATHSSILVWRIPRAEEPGGLQSMESQELDTTERLNHHHSEVNDWEASDCRRDRCFHQKSWKSGEDVDSCPENNAKDAAQLGQFPKGNMGEEETQWVMEARGWVLHPSSLCRLADSLLEGYLAHVIGLQDCKRGT